MRNTKYKVSLPNLITLFAGIIYVSISSIYLFLGSLNGDEGWYLYASKLVFSGNIPYRDFAYTQTPLLPYFYGLPQAIFGQSILVGRITSLVISTACFILLVLSARRYSNSTGGAVAALLLATFDFGIYNVSIVKTYALVTLCFTLSAFLLSTNIPNDWKYLLVSFVSCLAVFFRLSALFFAVPIIVYSFVKSSPKTRAILLISFSLLLFLTSYFAFTWWDAVMWNLFTHHMAQWNPIVADRNIFQNTVFRGLILLNGYVQFFPILFFSIFFWIFIERNLASRLKSYLQSHPEMVVIIISLFMFIISHFFTGGYFLDYNIPAVLTSLPFFAVSFVKIHKYLQGHNLRRFFMTNIFIATIFLSLVRFSLWGIDLSGGRPPLEEVRIVSEYVIDHTSPDDQILAMEALWVAVDSHRSVLAGMSMAQFSFTDMPRDEAINLHLINGEILVDYLNDRIPAVVVITDHDWVQIAASGYEEPFRNSLLNSYKLGFEMDHFGQFNETIYVFLPR